MKKDAFYFPHDSNARTDEKILFIRSKYGMEGYGLYWMFIEAMHESGDGRLTILLLDGLAYSFNVDITLLKQFYNDCITAKLFECDERFYWSNRVIKNKIELEAKRSAKSKAGKKGMESRWAKDNRVITENNSVNNSDNKGKERKVNEIKEEDISPPSSPISENAETSIDSSKDRNELAAALGKIQVSEAEMITWQQLKKLKCLICDVEAARKRIGKNSLNYLKNSICEERDKRTAADKPEGVDLEEYFGKGTKLQ